MVMAALENKAEKIIEIAAPLVGVGVGIITTLNVGTSGKLAPTAPLNQKLVTFSSLVAGPSVGNSIAVGMGVANPVLPPASFTPTKALNGTTFTGVGILITNEIIKSFNIHGYNKYAAPFIGNIGAGTLAGGVVGGLFQDPPAHAGGGGGFSSGFAAGGRVGATARIGYSGF